MPLIGTRGVASASGFGFGATSSPYWLGFSSPNTFETIRSIQVDGSGNIYIAGDYNFDFTYGYYRCFIQKYSAAGVLLWGRFYGTGSNVFNVPIITLDNTSSPSFVYMLAGRSSDKVAVLIKISAADGSVSWARQISGSSSFSWDGVAVSSGNIFIVRR